LSLSIDVVIPTYEQWQLTESCLRHLREQTMTHAVIVADNGSTDGTPKKIASSFPEVQVIALDANLGFTVACNRGAAAGTGDIIVLLNNDVEARPDFLERLVGPFEESQQVGTATALLVQPGEQTIDCMGLTADRTLAGFPRLRGRPIADAASRSPVLTGPSGGAGAYRRAAWEQVGGLDEGVKFYGEDVDLALRLRAAGWETAAVPDAVGVHLGSASFGPRSGWQRYQSGFARGYFLRRYRVMHGTAAIRALATESIVVAGDAALNRDLSGIRGRVAGWRSAGGLPRSPTPPDEAVDSTISLLQSMRLRRAAYTG
jgi:N-acetylglucosaminyl-diphospho-decaprenol L-rhamnosyltransferase